MADKNRLSSIYGIYGIHCFSKTFSPFKAKSYRFTVPAEDIAKRDPGNWRRGDGRTRDQRGEIILMNAEPRKMIKNVY